MNRPTPYQLALIASRLLCQDYTAAEVSVLAASVGDIKSAAEVALDLWDECADLIEEQWKLRQGDESIYAPEDGGPTPATPSPS